MLKGVAERLNAEVGPADFDEVTSGEKTNQVTKESQ